MLPFGRSTFLALNSSISKLDHLFRGVLMSKWVSFLLLILVSSCAVDLHVNDCNERLDRIIRSCVKKSKKEGLFLIGSGGDFDEDKITEICIAFETHDILDIAEARKVILGLSQRLTDLIERYPAYRTCFSNESSLQESFFISVFGPRLKDNNSEYPTSVVMREGKLYYSRSDGVKSLGIVHEETYTEAKMF